MIAFARAIAGSQSIFVEYSPPFPTRLAQKPSLSCLVFLGLWWRRRRARVRCLVFLGQWWKEYCFER
ncbi:hypothetical protein, partial [Actinomyces israelii]